jgi:hypothetical protein
MRASFMTFRRAGPCIKRWISVMLLAAIGAIVFEVSLPLGWYYATKLPAATHWFHGWFVHVVVWLVVFVMALLVVEPIRFRLTQLRRLHLYPPLWLSIVLAVACAALIETTFPPRRQELVPPWLALDVLLPLGIATLVAVGVRQARWSWANRPEVREEEQADAPITWELLERWFQKEEPLRSGPDLFEHTFIAERIYDATVLPDNQAVALIGAVGSGKSSILNMVKRKLQRAEVGVLTVVAEFSCWALPSPEDAPRLALERTIAALDDLIDTQAIRGLPGSYQRIVSAEPTGRVSRLLGVDDVPDPVERLGQLSSVLQVLGARLLLVIEDAERAGEGANLRALERFLWTLRNVQHVSFILALDARAGLDYSKLCDIIERIPLVTANRVEEVLAPAYARWRALSENWIDPIPDGQRKDRLGLENVTNPIARYVRRTGGKTAADAITALLNSPRRLKHFIRDVDRAWKGLQGEVELDDLIVLTALRHSAPDVFDFIVENAEAARSDRSPEQDVFEGEAIRTVRARWEALRNSLMFPIQVQSLVNILNFQQLMSEGSSQIGSSPQGVHIGEPVDYLARILAGRVLPGEIRDQVVLTDMRAWQECQMPTMLSELVSATSNSFQYVRVWEHHSTRLSTEELVRAADELIAAVLNASRADASMQHPAMLAIWRQCNRRVARDSRTDWLIEKIREVLPTSLSLANGLYNYWASIPHGITSHEHRARVRLALVEQAKETFTSVRALLAALGPMDEYPLTRLIYPPPTDEPPDPVPFRSWRWFANLVIAAAEKEPARIVPDIAALFLERSHELVDGALERRYRLRRERVREIFDDRSDDMLRILATYQGDDEYGVAARDEARRAVSENHA